MPIELYDGQTGPRLIARPPVNNKSYAVIELVEAPTLVSRVVASYQGGESYGWPALSPVMMTLPYDVQDTIEDERQNLIDEQGAYLSTPYQEGALEVITIYQCVIPILSSPKKGEKLWVVLPEGFTTKRHYLGVVEDWEIHNPRRPAR